MDLTFICLSFLSNSRRLYLITNINSNLVAASILRRIGLLLLFNGGSLALFFTLDLCILSPLLASLYLLIFLILLSFHPLQILFNLSIIFFLLLLFLSFLFQLLLFLLFKPLSSLFSDSVFVHVVKHVSAHVLILLLLFLGEVG